MVLKNANSVKHKGKKPGKPLYRETTSSQEEDYSNFDSHSGDEGSKGSLSVATKKGLHSHSNQ